MKERDRDREKDLKFTILLERRIRANLIEAFSVTNSNFQLWKTFFMFHLELEIYFQDTFQKLCLLTNLIFFILLIEQKKKKNGTYCLIQF